MSVRAEHYALVIATIHVRCSQGSANCAYELFQHLCDELQMLRQFRHDDAQWAAFSYSNTSIPQIVCAWGESTWRKLISAINSISLGCLYKKQLDGRSTLKESWAHEFVSTYILSSVHWERDAWYFQVCAFILRRYIILRILSQGRCPHANNDNIDQDMVCILG